MLDEHAGERSSHAGVGRHGRLRHATEHRSQPAGERPSWRFLAAMGLIGGGPTFFGTLVGQSFVNDTLFLSFLALAAGSILYVIVQLIKVAGRQHQAEVVMWGMFAGLVAGFATDYVLVAAGV